MPRLRALIASLRLAGVGLHLLYGALQVALLFPILSTPRQRRLKQIWSQQLLGRLGIELQCDPAAVSLDGLIVSNHVSFVDIFVINALTATAFVSKDDVARWPLIGWLCRRTETVFLARGSRTAAHRTHLEMVRRLNGGERIAVFPEGTTTDGQQVLPFHAALFQSAIDAAVPVSCVAISYHATDGSLNTDIAYIDDVSLLQCLFRIACAGRTGVRVVTAATLPQASNRRHLAQHAHQHINAALHQLRLSAA